MSLRVANGFFVAPGGAPGTISSVSGLGFTPKAVILMCSGQQSSTDASARATSHFGFGVAASNTDMRTYCQLSVNNVSPTVTWNGHSNTDVLRILLDGTGAFDGALGLNSFFSDGFSVIVNVTFTIAVRVFYLAIGGDDIVNTKTGQFQVPAAGLPGVQAITGLGFEPDFLLIFGGNENLGAPVTSNSNGVTSFGMMSGTAEINQAVNFGLDTDAVATSTPKRFFSTGIAAIASNGTAVRNTAVLQSFDSDGFTLNWNDNTGANTYFHYLAIKGGLWTVGLNSLTTDTSLKSITNIPYQVLGGLVTQAGLTTESVALSANEILCIGMFSGPTFTNSVVLSAAPGNPSISLVAETFVPTILCGVTSPGGGFSFKTSLISLDTTGFTWQNTSAPGSAILFAYAVFGSSTVPSTTPFTGDADYQWLGGNEY